MPDNTINEENAPETQQRLFELYLPVRNGGFVFKDFTYNPEPLSEEEIQYITNLKLVTEEALLNMLFDLYIPEDATEKYKKELRIKLLDDVREVTAKTIAFVPACDRKLINYAIKNPDVRDEILKGQSLAAQSIAWLQIIDHNLDRGNVNMAKALKLMYESYEDPEKTITQDRREFEEYQIMRNEIKIEFGLLAKLQEIVFECGIPTYDTNMLWESMLRSLFLEFKSFQYSQEYASLFLKNRPTPEVANEYLLRNGGEIALTLVKNVAFSTASLINYSIRSRFFPTPSIELYQSNLPVILEDLLTVFELGTRLFDEGGDRVADNSALEDKPSEDTKTTNAFSINLYNQNDPKFIAMFFSVCENLSLVKNTLFPFNGELLSYAQITELMTSLIYKEKFQLPKQSNIELINEIMCLIAYTTFDQIDLESPEIQPFIPLIELFAHMFEAAYINQLGDRAMAEK